MRRSSSMFLACAALALAATLHAAPKSSAPAGKSAANPASIDTATFAMGCFWCGETQFTQQPGVKSVTSGYTGGHKANPSYEEVCTGTTGHYESVRVVFDPAKTSYATLLDMFWHGIDPTQADGQFCDEGSQYRSVVFVRNASQRKAAEDSRRALEKSGVLQDPIVTQVLPAARFWPAEEYHQCFWQKSPDHYRAYRKGCRRDERLAQLWGDKAAKPLVH